MSYPRTIDNGAGQRITFVGRRRDDEGREWLDLESEIAPGAGPPMHLHQLQDESLTVISGALSYRIASGPTKTAQQGDTVVFERGVAHRFWNHGTEPARCSGWVSPPGHAEEFLTEMYEASAKKGGRISLGTVVGLLDRYKGENDIVMPSVLRAILFPVVRLLNRRR